MTDGIVTYAIVRFKVPAFHRWPNAPEHRKYLATEHRHLFHVECGVEVEHDEREIEFHDLLEDAEGHFMLDGEMSCEMAAKHLLDNISRLYPRRRAYVDVFEDGECGTRMMTEV